MKTLEHSYQRLRDRRNVGMNIKCGGCSLAGGWPAGLIEV